MGRSSIPLVCALFSGALAKELELRLRRNGASWKEETYAKTAGSLESLREQIEQDTSGLLTHARLGKAWWLADEDGNAVSSWDTLEALPQEKRLLSIVPEDKLFQWSPRKLGERWSVKVDDWEGAEMESVASSPKIFLLHNLFTEKETLFLINRAVARTGENALGTSGVGFSTSGVRDKLNTRTSASAFDSDSSGAKVLIKRCFDVLRIPFNMTQADGLQILRYQEGQAYVAHTDWFGLENKDYNFDPTTTEGTNRFATVFLYLWPPPSGGYTVFPQATIDEGLEDSDFISTGRNSSERTQAMMQVNKFYDQGAWELGLTKDCYSKLSVKPVRLGAALFYHQEPMTGKLLHEATHGACPSVTGTKWGANLWIWNRPRHLSKPLEAAKNNMDVVFENKEKADVQIEYSMDDASTWKFFTWVEVGKQFGARTFPGHYWRFTDKKGNEILRWLAPEDVKSMTVSTDGSHASRTEM